MASNFRRSSATALGLALGLAAGRVGYPAADLTRMMIAGQRQPLWRAPADLGLSAEEVVFGTADDVILRGWFIRHSGGDRRPAPAIVFVHGWPWNRLGNRAGGSLLPDRTVDFLGLAAALSQAGFHTLLFDLRNHGQSDAAWPVTFGVNEARDFAAAVSQLRRRPDVDGRRIGAIGFSMGANTLIYGIPRCLPIRAAVAVQPTTPAVFAPRLARQLLG
ncbi:MAG TPA: alpha/beta fold hydrolase, partial [Kouleothrix sp.]|nr:alpha/beta fold hydrolase [Kouleothrix sp.]